MSDSEYLGRALNQRAYDVGRNTGEALEIVMRQAAAKGTLGSGNTLYQFGAMALEGLTGGFGEAAKFTYSLAETNQGEPFNALKYFGTRIVDLISAELTGRAIRLGLPDHTIAPWLSKTKVELQEKKDRLLDDFEHGMHGSERLKKDPVVSVINSQTNSPGAIQQVGFGTFSQTAFTEQHAPLVEAIDAVLASDEFNGLEPQLKDGFKDIAEIVRGEASKPQPDVGKLQRWSSRLLEFSKAAGMKIAENALINVLVKIFF